MLLLSRNRAAVKQRNVRLMVFLFFGSIIFTGIGQNWGLPND